MNFQLYVFVLIFFLTSSCGTGKLVPVADLPISLKETSAIEITKASKLLWVIEDSGNKNNLYGLSQGGKIIKNIEIKNVQNIDWEELTSDDFGNIYIGDFGNNSKKRKSFAIFKVRQPDSVNQSTTADVISFKLPKGMKSEDFESFFLFKNAFYLFSKTNKKCKLFKVPNQLGDHVAEFISEYKFEAKITKVTSADISDDGKTVVLLNHDKLWKLSGFTSDNFFNGVLESLKFEHNTQKEGICFKSSNSVYITDERHKSEGGNIYTFTF